MTVTVYNLLEVGPKCSKKPSTYDLDIFLGSNFETGKRYTVNVNGETIKFTAE